MGYAVFFSGQGPDELFAGYKEFSSILEKGGFPAVQEECWNKLYGMHERNSLRERAIARHFNLEARTPFFFPEFMKQAMLCPPEKKIFSHDDELRKREFRKLAISLGLPKEIAMHRKKAMQYDSGTSKALRNFLT